MSIIFRYVFRQAAGSLMLILSSLSGIVWIALALRQLNVVTSQGQDAWMLIKMTTLALPNLMAVIAPFALLIASIHTLNRLNGDSELIVLTAAGGTTGQVAKPLLFLALLVSVAVAYVNHIAMPWSLQLLNTYIVQMRTDLLSQVIQPGRFSSPETNLTFHIRERDLSGKLRGIIMHDTRDPKQSQSYLAEHGVIVKQPPSAFLVMTEGHIVRRPKLTEPAQIIQFDRYIVDLNRFEQKESGGGDLKPSQLYTSEVWNPNPKNWFFQSKPGMFRSELHERFSNPLYPFAFVMLALAAVGNAQSTRQNRSERVVIGFVSAAVLRGSGLAMNNLVLAKAAMVPAMYALPIGAVVLSLVVMIRASRPRRRSRLAEAVGSLADGLAGLFRRPPQARTGATGS